MKPTQHDRAILYLLMGLPGSGKTTTAKTIAKLTGSVHLSSDSFRLSLFESPQFTDEEHTTLYKMLDYMCELLLASGQSVVYDANLNRYKHRQEKYQLAKKVHANVVLCCLQVPHALAKSRRIATQHHALVPKHESPDAMFDRIAQVYEPPQASEHAVELDGTLISSEYVAKRLGV